MQRRAIFLFAVARCAVMDASCVMSEEFAVRRPRMVAWSDSVADSKFASALAWPQQ